MALSGRPLRGTLKLPGDKSIAHRALMLAALAGGTSTLEGLGGGGDVSATASCLERLGVRVDRGEVWSVVAGGLSEATDVLDVGNSGTSIRCLTGLCAGLEGCLSVLTGDASVRSRPMLRVVAPLREMGASIAGARHGDRAPLAVTGRRLRGITRELDIASAQIKTALLLAGLLAEGRTEIVSPGPSRDHTERMLSHLGAPVAVDGATVAIEGGWRPEPFQAEIPGDISSAMFLVVAAIITPGSELSMEGLGLNPTRTGALEVLAQMGADVSWHIEGERLGEPVGTVTARHSPELRATEIAGSALIPRLIDEIPILAIAAAYARGTTTIRDAEELRVKESDRVATVADGLSVMGVPVRPTADGLVIEGGGPLSGGTVRSRGDHRIALAFAVAGLGAKDKVTVEGWNCVDTSFPEFLELLGQARSGKARRG
ncbi:MAG: 3-phosphoshikimate 1-carboxyvinyltransferase [Actinomycetota bacterium]